MQEEIIQEETQAKETAEQCAEAPEILEEITMEEMAVDGICGIY